MALSFNLSNCNYEVPYVYVSYGEALPFLSYPLAAFTLFLIIWKSPDYMKEYRIHLVMLQFFSIFYELAFLMMVPETWFPAWGARYHGPWGQHFSCRYTFITGTVAAGLVNNAIVQILSFKHQRLLPPESLFKLRYRTWIILVAIFYVNQMVILCGTASRIKGVDGYYSPQMQLLFSQYPCLSLVGDVSGLCAPEEDAPIRVCAYAVLYIIASNTILNSIFIHHSMHILNQDQDHMSLQTRKMQKLFLINLAIQLFIQLIAMGAPWIWVMGSTLAGLGLHLTLNHVLFGIFLSHGLINSLTTIFIIKPYRLEVFRMIFRKNWEDVMSPKLSTIQVSEMTITPSSLQKRTSIQPPSVGTEIKF